MGRAATGRTDGQVPALRDQHLPRVPKHRPGQKPPALPSAGLSSERTSVTAGSVAAAALRGKEVCNRTVPEWKK